MTDTEIIIYGAFWCGDCRRAKKYFDANKIAYKWINIDRDHDGRAFVTEVNGGQRIIPTILFPDGSILVEPSNAELEKKFLETG